MNRLLGISAFCKSKDELLSKISAAESFIQVHSLYSEILVMAKEDKTLDNILKNNGYNICDGYWVAKALGLKYDIDVEKISGSDFIFDLLNLAASLNWRVFLLGASEDVSNIARKKIGNMYKNLEINAYSPPYYNALSFPKYENSMMLRRIESFRPQILIVCFGPPKQEYWLQKNKNYLEELGVKISLSAGGTLDFIAGKVKRAPKWIQNVGMEWLYRLYKEPKSRFGRQVKRLPKFFILALHDVTGYKIISLRRWKQRY